MLDVYRGRIDLSKVTYNNRAHQVVVLVRLDLGSGVSHRYPDSQEIVGPHLHVYLGGYGDKWAQPVWNLFDLSNPLKALDDFMRLCNITRPPLVEGRPLM